MADKQTVGRILAVHRKATKNKDILNPTNSFVSIIVTLVAIELAKIYQDYVIATSRKLERTFKKGLFGKSGEFAAQY